MTDRAPEQMPSDWVVKSFASENGFGTLVHASGDEVQFTIDVWNTGDWRPTRKELNVFGGTSPLLPREGEPVKVAWKLSRAGKTVPALVQPTGRKTGVKEYKLSAWLKAVQRHTGKFAGLTPSKLLKPLAEIDEGRVEDWSDGEPRGAEDFAHLLADLADTHSSWIYHDDWRWDRATAKEKLPAMIGIKSVPEPAGPTESLAEYVARCNDQAEKEGSPLRLCNADTTDDERVFLALEPEGFAALVKDEYLITEK